MSLARPHRQIPAPPLRYSAPLIKFLPSQDPQAVVGNPELVIQPLPRADKCHVVLKNGWIWAIGLFWGSKISSVHIFLLKTEEILYWNVNMMKLVTCHSPASHCNVSGAWVSCPSSLFYARSAFFLHISLIKAIHVFFLQIMMFLHSPCSWLALKQHPQHCNGASCCCCWGTPRLKVRFCFACTVCWSVLQWLCKCCSPLKAS